MAKYVQVENNVVVVEFGSPFVADNLIAQGKTIIDVTDIIPQPTIGWTYENDEFDMPLIPHALIEDNVVTNIVNLYRIESWYRIEELGENFIDLTNKSPIPEVGWSYIDEKFIAQ